MYKLILVFILCYLIYRGFILNKKKIYDFLNKHPKIQSILLIFFHSGIELYTFIQIKYNSFYKKYLDNYFKKKPIINYYEVNLKNINCFTFEKENDEYEEKLKKNGSSDFLYVKEVIDNEKNIYFANGSKNTNLKKFKSNILGASLNFKIDEKNIEVDISEFIQKFALINNVNIELFYEFYKKYNPSTNHKNNLITNLMILDDCCNEKFYTETITI